MQYGFIAAMAADLAFAAQSAPNTVESRDSEWIIVSNWGGNRDFLTLSRTGAAVRGHDAPPGLQPCATFLGILFSRVGAGTEEVSEYLLMRDQPADIPVGGVFLPTDGFVRLTRRDGIPGIVAHGRFAHAPARLPGGEPAVPGTPQAGAWHLNATRRPWIGEVAAAERLVPRLAVPSRASPLPRSRRPVQALVVPSRSCGAASPGERRSMAEPSLMDHLAPAGPTPHNRRRKRPEAKHDVTSEA
jgi:hypothetical protein